MDVDGLPGEALQDPCGPPKQPCQVRCLHCGETYSSSEMVWRKEGDGPGLWFCPTEGCTGAGFDYDIVAVD